MSIRNLLGATILGLTVSASAMAQDPAATTPAAPAATTPAATTPVATTPAATGTYPQALADRPVTLPASMFEGRLDIGASLSTGAIFKAFSIGPAVRYGLTDDLELGLGVGIGITDPGGVSFGGLNLGGYYTVVRGDFRGAAHLNVFVPAFDPFALSVGVGFKGIFQADRLALTFDPQVVVRLAPSGGTPIGIALPVTLSYNVSPEFAPFLITGFNLPSLDPVALAIPLGVGAQYSPSNMLDLGLRFTFDSLITNNGANADARTLGLFAAFRM